MCHGVLTTFTFTVSLGSVAVSTQPVGLEGSGTITAPLIVCPLVMVACVALEEYIRWNGSQ